MEEYLKENNLIETKYYITIDAVIFNKLPNGIYKNYLRAILKYNTDYSYILIKKYNLNFNCSNYIFINEKYNDDSISYFSFDRNIILSNEYFYKNKLNKSKFFSKKLLKSYSKYHIYRNLSEFTTYFLILLNMEYILHFTIKDYFIYLKNIKNI